MTPVYERTVLYSISATAIVAIDLACRNLTRLCYSPLTRRIKRIDLEESIACLDLISDIYKAIIIG